MGFFDLFKPKKKKPVQQSIQQSNPNPTPQPIQKPTPPPKIRKEFTLDEAIALYAETDHSSCKSEFDYKLYFSDAFETILNSIPKTEIRLSDEKIKRKQQIENPIDNYKNITKKTNYKKISDFIAIDTETTGLKPGGNDIIEIAAIKFCNFRPSEIFHTYLKPRKAIPADASKVNGITDDMVADSPTFSQVKPALQEFISDFPLVAHNAPFDMKFLHVSGLDLEKHNGKVYDTLQLAQNKVRDYCGDKLESYKLISVCKELNIGCNNYHNAAADALACGLMFVDILKIVKEVKNIDDAEEN